MCMSMLLFIYILYVFTLGSGKLSVGIDVASSPDARYPVINCFDSLSLPQFPSLNTSLNTVE